MCKMKWLIAILLTIVCIDPVLAENCTRSRDYILDGLAGDLPKPPKTYQDLFKACIETLGLPNVKDAYILKDGAIAISPMSISNRNLCVKSRTRSAMANTKRHPPESKLANAKAIVRCRYRPSNASRKMAALDG